MALSRFSRCGIALASALSVLAITACDPGNSSRLGPDEVDTLAATGRLSARAATPSSTVPVGLSVQSVISGGRQFALYVPSNYTPSTTWPTTVLLHGQYESGEQMALDFQSYAEAAGVVVLAPNSYGPSWDLIMNSAFGIDRAYIDNMLKWAFDHIAIDPTRLTISGFSDGATYALWLGLKNGDLFSKIAAFTPCSTVPHTRTGTPELFISHGTDDQVFLIANCSRQTVPSLEEAGYTVQYVEYPSPEGNGHFVTPAVITQGMTFLSQH